MNKNIKWNEINEKLDDIERKITKPKYYMSMYTYSAKKENDGSTKKMEQTFSYNGDRIVYKLKETEISVERLKRIVHKIIKLYKKVDKEHINETIFEQIVKYLGLCDKDLAEKISNMIENEKKETKNDKIELLEKIKEQLE
jgi:Asp-tRNA(Asn)/Glu-tRNA(Gln) amidotransferase B subunit